MRSVSMLSRTHLLRRMICTLGGALTIESRPSSSTSVGRGAGRRWPGGGRVVASSWASDRAGGNDAAAVLISAVVWSRAAKKGVPPRQTLDELLAGADGEHSGIGFLAGR
jgi:hypothetical protein